MSTLTERRYEHLYGDELFARIREKPLAWFPFGVLEHHGQHLPFGLDALKAHAACLWLADRLGGVVLPACHNAGIHGDGHLTRREVNGHLKFLGYSEDTLRAILEETFASLANLDFQVIVAYTGHYPVIQLDIVAEVAEKFTATGKAMVIPFCEKTACGEGDHAGKIETSLYMALAPGGARVDAVREDVSGKRGTYREQKVKETSSVALGESILKQCETYLADAIAQAFARQTDGDSE